LIPVRIIVTGDASKGRELIGFAKNQMSILENLMSFQSLNQGSRTVSPFPGVVVECWSSFSLQEIRIYVEEFFEEGEEKGEYIEVKECFCNCNFSFGVVIAVGEELEKDISLYDVAACKSKEFFVLYQNIIASDFAQYSVGQKVLVMSYNNFSYLCCNGGQTVSACSPEKSSYLVSDDEWRTTYRILPLCAEKFSRWFNYRRITDV
jgi:hypothetical protein